MKNNFLTDSFSGMRQICQRVGLLTIMFLCVFGLGVSQVHASCITIDDVPLDTQEQAAPGIVMFVIDDSGSMDWEYMCQGQIDGKFLGKYEYIFADPGDNAYSVSSSNGTILEGSSDANKVKSQCANFWVGTVNQGNRLYYDPTATYTPWPTYSDADPTSPRSNPAVSGNTLNLGTVYHSFSAGSSGVSTQDILDAGGVIVDDSDVGTVNGDIIVDNYDDEYSESGGWSNSSASNEYNGQSRYTSSSGNYATWRPNVSETGIYKVYIWYCYWNTRDTNAKYVVKHQGVLWSTRINQKVNAGQWVELGDFEFDAGDPGNNFIRVKRDASSTGSSTSADAVKLVPQFSATPGSSYQETGTWANSSASNEYAGQSRWTDTIGSYATWTPALSTSGTYTVYVWYTTTGNRDANAKYTVHDSTGDTVISPYIDQDENAGQWVPLGEFDFDAGTSGYVKVERHAGSTGNSTSADAVAFMPGSGVVTGAVDIVRAHYYVQSSDKTKIYLVNMNGSLEYYEFDDKDSDYNVDSAIELVSLTPAEAATAGIFTGRTYAQERQNFANWYSFYRKRELTAKNAIATVITDMQGVYIGLHTINRGLKSIAKPVSVTLDNATVDESSALLTSLFSIYSMNSTPLRNGLNNIGRYFQGLYGKPSPLPSTDFADNTYPFFTADKGGSCQQAFAIVMTDGYWNGSAPDLGDNNADNADKKDDSDQIDGFDGFPFADDASNTLADVAMYYYEHDLNATLNNDVPINTKDQANHQHLVTYALSFGLIGSLDRNNFPDCPLGTCPSPWPTPTANNNTTIDDLFHASVNGRGKYVDAASPQEMVDAMNELKHDIESRLGSSAALATNSIQRQVGTTIYQGTYNTSGWFGEVTALPLDLDGNVGTADDPGGWRASEHVPDWNSRNIITYNGTVGVPFTSENITTAQEALLSNNGHDPAALVNFIRGDVSNNLSHGGPFRVRSKPIGDIVHSAPTYYNGVVYIGANDGMLHAISSSTGEEVFCYVPGMVYDHLSDLALPGYSHRYYVDSTPTAGRVNGKEILVSGLGKGGKGYFGLNVTDSSNPTALWEYTNDDDLGYSFSYAKIVNTKAGRVVVFGNGYDSVNQTAVLFFLNPETGAVVRKLDTQSGGCNGLAAPKVVDVDGDGVADFVFAGDLNGNMWKFDIRSDDANEWRIYYNNGSPQPLLTAINSDGDVQPITAAPEVMLDCAKNDFAVQGNGLMVIFGTGQYLNSDDFGNIPIQSLYGIWDWGDIWETRDGYDVAKTKYLGEVQTNRSLNNVSGTSLQEQTVASSSGKWLTLSDNTVDWYNPDDDDSTGSHMGWVFDLPGDGERSIREPTLRMGVAVFVSTIPSSSPCDAGGSSVVYQVSACSGGRTEDPQFDVSGDGKIDDADLIDDQPPTGEEFDEMLFEPIEIGDLLYFSDSGGGINPMTVPPNLVGMQFWRVIQ